MKTYRKSLNSIFLFGTRATTLAAMLALAVLFGVAGALQAASILFVSDVESDNNIPLVLVGDGYTVMTVLNDYSTGNNPALSGDLSAYNAVFWSATGVGSGGTHNASTFSNLSSYVSAGGRVFVTGYDSIASPTDDNLIYFLGEACGLLTQHIFAPSLECITCIRHNL